MIRIVIIKNLKLPSNYKLMGGIDLGSFLNSTNDCTLVNWKSAFMHHYSHTQLILPTFIFEKCNQIKYETIIAFGRIGFIKIFIIPFVFVDLFFQNKHSHIANVAFCFAFSPLTNMYFKFLLSVCPLLQHTYFAL